MTYRDKVLNYFGFSSGVEVQAGNKTNKQICIDGTAKTSTCIFYIFFVSFFSVIPLIANGQITFERFFKCILLPLITIIYVFIKHKRLFKKLEPKPRDTNIYQRELPSNLKPAHVRMLLTDGLIDSTSMASTIFDLIDRGYIELSKNTNKPEIFKDEEIILTKTDKNQEDLLEYERFLIKWFFDICGDKRKISNLELKKVLSHERIRYVA